MNYIADRFDLSLLQFGPADARVKELSYRQVASETHREQFWWTVKPDSPLREALSIDAMTVAFKGVKELEHPELVGYDKDDKVIVVIEAPDSHLFVAGMGFRYFLITFEKREIGVRLVVGSTEVPVPKVTE